MKKCPQCAEEIQDEAIKCKYCGGSQKTFSQKFINVVENLAKNAKKNTEEADRKAKAEIDKFDYSNVKRFRCLVKNKDGRKRMNLTGIDLADLEQKCKIKGLVLLKSKVIESKGEYSCPRCKSLYTKVSSALSLWLVLILSILTGGIFFPIFLYWVVLAPGKNYECQICDYTWRVDKKK